MNEFRRMFSLSTVKYFTILAKAVRFSLILKHNDIICLLNVSSLYIVIPKSSSQGINSNRLDISNYLSHMN